jgi:hypothetical protein
MSNNYSINSAGLNGSSGPNVVVGFIVAATLAISGVADAYITAGSKSTGTTSTVVIAQANQIHYGRFSGTLTNVTGSCTVVRQAGYLPKVDTLSTTGSKLSSFLYTYGGSSNTVDTQGVIAPNYFVEPSLTGSGVLDTSLSINPLRLKIGTFTAGTMGLTGYLIPPVLVPVEDIFVITGLDGYCISANELGYGSATLGTVVTCDAVRIVPVEAHVTLWEDGPQLITNDAGYYRGSGNVALTGLTNVAIKKENFDHFIWYYEDWLTLNIGSMVVTPVVYKEMKSEAITQGLDIAVTTEGTRRATARLNPIEVQVYGILDTEKKAGLLAKNGYLRTRDVLPLYYEIRKSPSLSTDLTTTGVIDVLVFKEMQAFGDVTTSVQVLDVNRIVNFKGITTSDVSLYGSSTAQRVAVGYSVGEVKLGGNTVELVYKHSEAYVDITTTGAIDSAVMFTSQPGLLATSGFTVGERVHVSNLAMGDLSTIVSAEDTRLAVRYDETSYWTTLEDSGNDYRLAVRLESHETLPTSGTLFDVVNLFVRADETRQISVAPSPFKGKTTQNYIEVVA